MVGKGVNNLEKACRGELVRQQNEGQGEEAARGKKLNVEGVSKEQHRGRRMGNFFVGRVLL